MAAKIASRKSEKVDKDFEPHVVVEVATGRRAYLGEGVPRAEAERIAAGMAREARAVPLADVDVYGRLIVPDEEAPEPQVSEEAEVVAA